MVELEETELRRLSSIDWPGEAGSLGFCWAIQGLKCRRNGMKREKVGALEGQWLQRGQKRISKNKVCNATRKSITSHSNNNKTLQTGSGMGPSFCLRYYFLSWDVSDSPLILRSSDKADSSSHSQVRADCILWSSNATHLPFPFSRLLMFEHRLPVPNDKLFCDVLPATLCRSSHSRAEVLNCSLSCSSKQVKLGNPPQ